MSALEHAIRVAVDRHAGQVDKAGQPYILHVLRVMLAMDNETDMIVAALHDTVEDTGLELITIQRHYGNEIAGAVDALTRRPGETYSEFVARCGGNPIAIRVKLADLADNMRLDRLETVTEDDRARVAKYEKARTRLISQEAERGRVSAD